MGDITKCDMVPGTSYDKTAMQDLLEFCEYRQTKAADGCKAAWNMILAKIKDDGLLEQEKQEKIEFAKWCDNNYNTLKVYNVSDLLELYNETFKNK